jgi:hypothetical protein
MVEDVQGALAGCNYKAFLCLFMKKAKGDEPQYFVIIYVDDVGIIGKLEEIKEVIEAMSKR